MHATEHFGQQSIARHGKPHPRLSELKHQQRRDHAHHGAEQHGQLGPVQQGGFRGSRQHAHAVDHGSGIVDQVVPRHDSGEHHGHRDIEHGADDQRGNDANGNIALRILGFFSRGRNGVESDVGEEDDGAAGEHARPAFGYEGMIVRGMNESHSYEDERQDGRNFQQHHDVVGFGRFANAAHQHDCQQQDNQKRGNVEAEVPAGRVKHVVLQIGESARQVRGRDPAQCGMPAEPVEGGSHVGGEADADRHVADRVFQDEVPADDPRDELAHRRVGVGVSAASDGDHGRQLGVAESGEGANDGHQDQRNRQRRSGAGTPQRGRMMHDVVSQRAVEN